MFEDSKQSNFSDNPLIPPSAKRFRSVPLSSPSVARSRQTNRRRAYLRSFAVFATCLTLLVAGFSAAGYAVFKSQLMLASPTVVFNSDRSPVEFEPLNYGRPLAVTEADYLFETQERFIEQALSFIEADLSAMVINYYEEGEVVFSAPILAKGREGSWWQTPAGIYEIGYKNKNHFSTFGQVNMPWSMAFQGNFFIHGWPVGPDGEPVPESYSGGCIRLSDKAAERLYELAKVGTPLIVHEEALRGDGFLYEPVGPELKTPHYLVADLKSHTVLAGSDLSAVAPIASITKLMTALIAAEYINLDKSVQLRYLPTIDSLVPRLDGRHTVSMYSLLQLLLVESSNEAAEVIAAELGREQFIARMNEKAAALGLSDTVFTDPSGLDAGNVSTLADLLRLSQYIYGNRRFIFELTRDQDLPNAYESGQFGELNNFNKLAEDVTFVGGKVGETLAAGQTSVSLHRLLVRGEERIIVVIILGSDGREADIKRLLQYVKDNFSSAMVAFESDAEAIIGR